MTVNSTTTNSMSRITVGDGVFRTEIGKRGEGRVRVG